MKRKSTILLFLVSGLISPSAWAIVGGPWDHLRGDSFSQSNTDGLYSASVTMANGSGFIRFSSRSDQHELADEQITSATVTGTGGSGGSITTAANLATRSNSVVYFEGKTYFGNTYGNVDSKAGTVFGSSSGVSVLAETIRSSLTSGGTSTTGTLIDISGLSETMSLAFTGNVFEKRPQIRFTAKGEVSFFSRPPLQVITTANGETILRIAAGASRSTSTLTTTRVQNTTVDPVTGATTTVDSTTTTNESEPSETSGADIQPDASQDVRILGGRISNIVPGPSNPLDLLSTSP